MILKALCNYYDLKKDSLPTFGTGQIEISFIIVINAEGNFIRFEDLRDSKKKRGKAFMVKRAEVRSSGIKANYLYDNGSYVLGIKDAGKASKRVGVEALKIESFHNKIINALNLEPENEVLKALNRFYCNYAAPDMDALAENASENGVKMAKDALWEELCANSSANMSFRIEHDTSIVAEIPHLIELDRSDDVSSDTDHHSICLITGKACQPVELTAATMIPGSQAVAKIVSFQTSQGYDSYGKSKCFNAPISPEAEFKYSTALKWMLGPKSVNKFTVATRTFLFWSTCADTTVDDSLNSGIMALFGSREVSPDFGTGQIRKVFTAIYSGELKSTSADRFYILALAPNSARIAVSFWAEMSVKEFAANILRHFNDMEICDNRPDKKPYTSLYSILAACIPDEKVSECKTKMPEILLKSIFSGTPYPADMLSACINRLRASKPLSITRAAVIKAFLNRNTSNQTPITPMLNPENLNPGYLCGRLFAVLDKIQQDANGIHSIRERYMNSASATPATIFPVILKLSNHHREKLSAGSQIFYEKIIREISEKLGDSMPTLLRLEDQGRFFLGYYQQTQHFYTAKDNETENKSDN